MDLTSVLGKLIEIGKAVGVKDESTVRRMIAEAQDCVLHLQQELVLNARLEPRTLDVRPRQGVDNPTSREFVKSLISRMPCV
jgi:hypothetical protein